MGRQQAQSFACACALHEGLPTLGCHRRPAGTATALTSACHAPTPRLPALPRPTPTPTPPSPQIVSPEVQSRLLNMVLDGVQELVRGRHPQPRCKRGDVPRRCMPATPERTSMPAPA